MLAHDMNENRYEILERLGQGGVGAVYKAYDKHLDREVAIKRVLSDEEAEAEASPENLIQEAKTLSALQHPNIITVYDVSNDEKGAFVVMELLDGETIEETIKRGALTFKDFDSLVEQSLEGLITAQAKGFVHRDIKPGNLMLIWHDSGKFQVKILDFGLAKFGRQPSVQTADQNEAILGSIYFMAPEQFERGELDGRTDLYAIGALYYYALTGRYAFDGETPAQVMATHLQHQYVPLERLRPDLPLWVSRWIDQLMSREIANRPLTAKEALKNYRLNRDAINESNDGPTSAVKQMSATTKLTDDKQKQGQTKEAEVNEKANSKGTGLPSSAKASKAVPTWALIFGSLILLGSLLVIGAIMMNHSSKKKEIARFEKLVNKEDVTGTTSDVDFLIKYLQANQGTQYADAAVAGLGKLKGPGISKHIGQALLEHTGNTKNQLLSALMYRRDDGALALDEILEVAKTDTKLRGKAINTIGLVGTPKDLPEIIEMLDSLQKDDHTSARVAISDLARLIPDQDKRSRTLMRGFKKLKEHESKSLLLNIIAENGSDSALSQLKNLLASKKSSSLAVNALGRWPTSKPLPILYEWFKKQGNEGKKIAGARNISLMGWKPGALNSIEVANIIEKVATTIPQKRLSDKHKLAFAMTYLGDSAVWPKIESVIQSADGKLDNVRENLKKDHEKRVKTLVNLSETKGIISPKKAIIEGKGARLAKDGSMTNWFGIDANLFWQLKIDVPGTYDIIVSQADNSPQAGKFAILIGGDRIEAKARKTGSKTEYQDVKVGSIEFENPGVYQMILSPISIGKDTLFELEHIKLVKN